MSITLNQLRVFMAIAKEKGLTKAAKSLYMTQPAISIQLKQLEDHYGLPLIEVIGKKVFLTQAGSLLYETCSTIFHQLNNLDMRFSQLQQGLSGKLNLAIVSTAAYFVPQFLEKFHQQYPQVEIQLKVANRSEILTRLTHNEDDLIILSQLPTDVALTAKPFLHDSLVVAAPINHPLAKKKQLSFSQLKEFPFILREAGSGTRMVMEKQFKKHRIQPIISMELGSNSAIKQAIIAGFGLSLVSKASIEHELALKKIKILDVSNFPLHHEWYIAHAKAKLLSPVAENFLTFLLTKG